MSNTPLATAFAPVAPVAELATRLKENVPEARVAVSAEMTITPLPFPSGCPQQGATPQAGQEPG